MPFEEKAPAFQFFANDRLAELMELSPTARGAWVTVVCKLWRLGPMDEDRLARIAGEDWKTIRFLFGSYSLTDGLPTPGEGPLLALRWMEEYRVELSKKRAQNAANGALGGRPPRETHSSTYSNSKRKTDRLANANPNVTTSARKNADADAVEEEVEEEEENANAARSQQDGVQGKDRPRHTDPRVPGLLAFLRDQRNGASLDLTERENLSYGFKLLRRIEQDYPGVDHIEFIKTVIMAGTRDQFHGKNLTEMRYLFNNMNKIISAHKLSITNPSKNAKRSLSDQLREQQHANG